MCASLDFFPPEGRRLPWVSLAETRPSDRAERALLTLWPVRIGPWPYRSVTTAAVRTFDAVPTCAESLSAAPCVLLGRLAALLTDD